MWFGFVRVQKHTPHNEEDIAQLNHLPFSDVGELTLVSDTPPPLVPPPLGGGG